MKTKAIFHNTQSESWLRRTPPTGLPWGPAMKTLRLHYGGCAFKPWLGIQGLDLIPRVPEELWTEVHNIGQEVVIKTIHKKKNCKKAEELSEEVLQIAEKRREWKAKEKRKDIPIQIQSSKEQQGEIWKPSSVISTKK